MSKRLAIIGASGHGKVVADIAQACGIKGIVFFDDRYKDLSTHYGFQVVGSVQDAIELDSSSDNACFDVVIVAIGNSQIRQDIQRRFTHVSDALMHPSAIVSESVTVGSGSVLMPNVVVNADTVIGQGCIINTGAIVEHDCHIGDFSHICPNSALAGGVTVGNSCWIGISSNVVQLIKIGHKVTVGAGAAVVNDIGDNMTVVGVPAKRLKERM